MWKDKIKSRSGEAGLDSVCFRCGSRMEGLEGGSKGFRKDSWVVTWGHDWEPQSPM